MKAHKKSTYYRLMAEKKDKQTTLHPNMKTPKKTTLLWNSGEKERQGDYPAPEKKKQQMQGSLLAFLFTIVP